MSLFDQPREAPGRRIIEYLQRQGTATIRELEALLGVTATAVRGHLSGLLAEGYVERRAVHRGMGRPHHAYALTDRASELFASRSDDLALTLLGEVLAFEGPERTDALLNRVGDRLAEGYSTQMQGGVLHERVDQLAQALERRGVLTDVTPNENGDSVVLRAYNCPFHELAQKHREICEMDARVMRQVLGAHVQLESCLMAGEARCAFVVRERDPGAEPLTFGAVAPAAQPAPTRPPTADAEGPHSAGWAPVSFYYAGDAADKGAGKAAKDGKTGKKKKRKK